MTTFYFVRHGKTELNLSLRFQGGEIDSPLLPVGVEQAIQAGRYLSDVRFDVVSVSTQKRAMDTANYLLKENNFLDGLTVQYHDSLREIKFGKREGVEIDHTDEQTDHLRNRPDLYDPTAFEGETIDSLVARSTKTIEKLSEAYPDGKVLIVAHGVLLITLINALVGKEKSKWREGGPLANTSISILENDQNNKIYTIKSFNDSSYQSQNEEA
ncbi:histidine phosphatase family protein [Candidatus Enterococcus ikei]|uniref:Histidine phosphatase family protein n=1 Tax=Candidatus Enterococcus ikei TaxID=2815326 RepID=A0ABS3H1E4_9ENTE|nr:histidine phosphatase family protein [Enterococcus sp. DIV0869a]MBO0441346.1 histidine phosphatase family protein [Enterococcus sp. DIV0869a]